MAYVITQHCCNDASCVTVCPVNCIHPTPDEPDYGTTEMLYIDADSCIDCGACVMACPINAVEPDYDLPDEFLQFQDLNAAYYRNEQHRDYARVPNSAPKRKVVPVEESQEPLKVAIIGSGPAAVYAAESLLDLRGPMVRVDMFERLATPWGLVRHGVAPDHQDTKTVVEVFNRVTRRPGFRLFLDVEVGKDLTREDLESRYHAVIWAVGTGRSRTVGVAGEDLPGSHTAADFVGWYNGHPDHVDRSFDLSGERAIILGNGNVALDIARVLLTDPAELARTDIADHALAELSQSRIREVHVVGRRGPAEAGFTNAELIGMLGVEGLTVSARTEEARLDDLARERLRTDGCEMELFKADLVSELPAPADDQGRQLVLRFRAVAAQICGTTSVESVQLARTEPVWTDGVLSAVVTDDVEKVDCNLVISSVGYRGTPIDGLPFDEARGILPNLAGRVIAPATGEVLAGSYVAGWVKRGPSGGIGTNRYCARETADSLVEDWRAGRLTAAALDADIADIVPHPIGMDEWKRIDAQERASGRAARRPRIKLVDRESQLEAASPAAVRRA